MHDGTTAASSTTCRACAWSTRWRSATARFDGLNLMFETREGILKHCSLANAQRSWGRWRSASSTAPSPALEAQLTNLADEIAYNSHDIDDGLRSGLITIAQLEEVDFFARHWHEVQAAYPGLSGRRAHVRNAAAHDHGAGRRRDRHLQRAAGRRRAGRRGRGARQRRR